MTCEYGWCRVKATSIRTSTYAKFDGRALRKVDKISGKYGEQNVKFVCLWLVEEKSCQRPPQLSQSSVTTCLVSGPMTFEHSVITLSGCQIQLFLDAFCVTLLNLIYTFVRQLNQTGCQILNCELCSSHFALLALKAPSLRWMVQNSTKCSATWSFLTRNLPRQTQALFSTGPKWKRKLCFCINAASFTAYCFYCILSPSFFARYRRVSGKFRSYTMLRAAFLCLQIQLACRCRYCGAVAKKAGAISRSARSCRSCVLLSDVGVVAHLLLPYIPTV